jgi:hypothetical protein
MFGNAAEGAGAGATCAAAWWDAGRPIAQTHRQLQIYEALT